MLPVPSSEPRNNRTILYTSYLLCGGLTLMYIVMALKIFVKLRSQYHFAFILVLLACSQVAWTLSYEELVVFDSTQSLFNFNFFQGLQGTYYLLFSLAHWLFSAYYWQCAARIVSLVK